jgi:hypothetical protein
VRYRETWFRVDDDDFDSKLAYMVLQLPIALDKTGNAPGTVIPIPAG